MPVRILAAVDRAAPVMAHCTTCSCELSSSVKANAAPVIAPATALFFCNINKKHNHTTPTLISNIPRIPKPATISYKNNNN